MIRYGRYTSALCLTALGVLLLLDLGGRLNALDVARTWWPAAIVALGIELILVQLANRREGTRIRPAVGSMIGTVLLGGIVLTMLRGQELQWGWIERWTSGVKWGAYDSDNAKYHFDKADVSIPVSGAGQSLTVTNLNGHVTVRQGDAADIRIRTTVHVDVKDADRAREIADQSTIALRQGEHAEVEAKPQSYGTTGLRHPRMDMTILLPRDQALASVDINVTNGDVRVETVETATPLDIDVKNGDVSAERIGGKLKLNLINGDIEVTVAAGDLEAKTINGEIDVRQARAAVTVSTVHGDIEVASDSVGGNWDVSSTMGDLKLAWPESAGVQVWAKSMFNDVNSDWPLSKEGSEYTGTVGDGKRQIRAETHTDIALEMYRP